MKRLSSILFAGLMVLAGMNLTFATHFCGGKMAATKISFAGKVATCGMEQDAKSTAPIGLSYTSNCCKNKISAYSVDNIYSPSEIHPDHITRSILHVFNIPESLSFDSGFCFSTNLAYISPPDNHVANAVSMAEICVFRI